MIVGTILKFLFFYFVFIFIKNIINSFRTVSAFKQNINTMNQNSYQNRTSPAKEQRQPSKNTIEAEFKVIKEEEL